MTRESLHARIADILLRSGVEDADLLVRAMERDHAEIAACLGIGRRLALWASLRYSEDDPRADAAVYKIRIDRALAGKEIGAGKPASEKP